MDARVLAALTAAAAVVAGLIAWQVGGQPTRGTNGDSGQQTPSGATGGGPVISWVGAMEVSYDFSLYQSGTVYWTAQGRFRTTGAGGRVSFTVTLEKENMLVGYQQGDWNVEGGGEYLLSVRGHMRTFPKTGPLTIYCPLTVSSPNSEDEMVARIELTTRMDYVYLDSISISPV
jgi:hypothetical protein